MIIMDRLYHFAATNLERLFCSTKRQASRMEPSLRQALAEDVARELMGAATATTDGTCTTGNNNNNDNNDALWDEGVEQELEQAQKRLQEMQAKEQFLGMRCYKYHQRLNDQARILQQEQIELLQKTKKQKQKNKKRRLQQQQKAQQHLQQEQEAGEQEAGEQGEDHSQEDDEDEDDDDENVEEVEVEDDVEALLDAETVAWERKMLKLEHEREMLQKVRDTHKQILVECETMRRKVRALEQSRRECNVLRQECQAFMRQAQECQEMEDAKEAEEEEEHDAEGAYSNETEMSNLCSVIIPVLPSKAQTETAAVDDIESPSSINSDHMLPQPTLSSTTASTSEGLSPLLQS